MNENKSKTHPIEWQRKRFRRWLEIVKAKPILPFTGTGGRAQKTREKQFKDRYAQLEEELPTPEREE